MRFNIQRDRQNIFTWGLDISAQNGNPGQDSGGVGALLVVTDTQLGSHYPCYDSNGNIIAMVNAATKAISAQYEYSPFGETTRATGPFAEANPYRFSTKPTDSETGLIYYGYRFYKPKWQTWPSRDPIGEEGGINLYGFVGNDGVNRWDLLGLVYPEVWEDGEDPDPKYCCDKEYKIVAISNDWFSRATEPAARRKVWEDGVKWSWDFRVLPENTSSNEQLLEQLKKISKELQDVNPTCKVCIKELTISGHGGGGGIVLNRPNRSLGNNRSNVFNNRSISKIEGYIKELKSLMCKGAVIKIAGCQTSGFIEHRNELQDLANSTGITIGGEPDDIYPEPDDNLDDNKYFHPQVTIKVTE